MTANPDGRVQSALPLAVQLVGAVRDRDPDSVATLLADADMPALAVTLAAMVDDDQRVAELLAWTAYDVRLTPTCDPALDRSPATTRAVHGTRSRYNRGCRGAGCVRAEREYQHLRYLRDVAEGKRAHAHRPTTENLQNVVDVGAATLDQMLVAS